MIAVTTAVPAAVPVSGLPLALTIAFAVTALAAIGMVVVQLRRTSRLTTLTGGLGAASAEGVLALTAFIGIPLIGAQSAAPPAQATSSSPATSNTTPLEGYQLPTLALDD